MSLYGKGTEGTAGVGVLVASELADRIIRVERVSDRVNAIDLVIGEQIVKVVSCYAPQAGRSQIEKEEFWRQMEGVIMNTGIHQEIIVGGDMNGHVDQVANGFHEAHGNFGYGTRNAEGERILEFAEAMGYVVTSTLFKKKQSHLVTYESGGNKTAVDIILIKREHKKRIMNTKVIPGEYRTSTRSSAYSISHSRPSLTLCVTASITIMKSSGLSTKPWCTPTFTPNHSLTDPSYDLILVLACLYMAITALTNHSSTPNFLMAHSTTFLGTLSKAFSSGVTAEMIMAAGEQAVDWLTTICNRIVKEEAIPESWQMSELVPIYKGKGDVLECGSSRGIKLLEHGMKIAERVLERRLRQAVEIDKIQFGFRPGTGTRDAIFIARQLQERYRGKHREL